MNGREFSKQSLVYCLIIFLLISTSSMCISTSNATTTEYLEWSAESTTPGAKGFLKINNFPTEFYMLQSYPVEIVLTVEQLENADKIEFTTINWCAENENVYRKIGYSVVDQNLTKGENVTLTSQWSIGSTDNLESLLSVIGTSLILYEDSNQINTTMQIDNFFILTIKDDTELRIKCNNEESKNPYKLDTQMGNTVTINGNLTSKRRSMDWVITETGKSRKIFFFNEKIEIIYTNPKGQSITHYTNVGDWGNFTDKFSSLNMTGVWFVEANFKGSKYFSNSTSNIAVITVGYRFPEITAFAVVLFPFFFLVVPYCYNRKRKSKIESISKMIINFEVPSGGLKAKVGQPFIIKLKTLPENKEVNGAVDPNKGVLERIAGTKAEFKFTPSANCRVGEAVTLTFSLVEDTSTKESFYVTIEAA